MTSCHHEDAGSRNKEKSWSRLSKWQLITQEAVKAFYNCLTRNKCTSKYSSRRRTPPHWYDNLWQLKTRNPPRIHVCVRACVRACNRGDPFLPLSPLTAEWGAHMPDDHHLSQARQRNSYIAISLESAQKKSNQKNCINCELINAKVNDMVFTTLSLYHALRAFSLNQY